MMLDVIHNESESLRFLSRRCTFKASTPIGWVRFPPGQPDYVLDVIRCMKFDSTTKRRLQPPQVQLPFRRNRCLGDILKQKLGFTNNIT
jgi:hypothetical protein